MLFPIRCAKRLSLLLTAFALTALPMSADAFPEGSYRGKITVGPVRLTLQFNISKDAEGNAVGTLDSPDQGVKGIAISVDYVSEDSVALSAASIDAEFKGHFTERGLDGVFSQKGHTFPLSMRKRALKVARRPQTPKPPYPYTTVDTTFGNREAGIVLAGTVVMPRGAGRKHRVPAVVFVSGSGLQNRDEELFGHRPFHVIADYLARRGIASLRYDDRGFGKSGGDGLSATTADFASDAAAAVEFLSGLEGIGKVGVIGHSEGGTIALMLAGGRKIRFAVSMAGAIAPLREVLLAQNRASFEKSGLAPELVEQAVALVDAVFAEKASRYLSGSDEPFKASDIAAEMKLDLPVHMLQVLDEKVTQFTPWLTHSLTVDAREYAARAKCPVLAINGDRDTQVDAAMNIGALKSAMPKSVVRTYPGLNHLFQHCRTGAVSEYGDIEETVSPEVLADIADFILGL